MGYQSFAKESQYDPIALNIAQVIEQDEKVRRNTRKGLQENKDLQSKWNSTYVDAMTQAHGVEERNIKENQEWFNENAESVHKKELQHLEIALKNTEQEDPTPLLEALTPFLLETGLKVAGQIKGHIDAKHQERVKAGGEYISNARLTTDQLNEARSNKEAILNNSDVGDAIVRKIAKENGLDAKELHTNLVNVLKRGGVDQIYHQGIAATNSAKGLQAAFGVAVSEGMLVPGQNGKESTFHEIQSRGNPAEILASRVWFANKHVRNGLPPNMPHEQLERMHGVKDKWIDQSVAQALRKAEEANFKEYEYIQASGLETYINDGNVTGFYDRRLKVHEGNHNKAQMDMLDLLPKSGITLSQLDHYINNEIGSDGDTLADRNRGKGSIYYKKLQEMRDKLIVENMAEVERQEKATEFEVEDRLDQMFEGFKNSPTEDQLNTLNVLGNELGSLAVYHPNLVNEFVRKVNQYNQTINPGIEASAPNPLTPVVQTASTGNSRKIIMGTLNDDDTTTYEEVQDLDGYKQAIRYHDIVFNDLFQKGMKANGNDVNRALSYAEVEIENHVGVQKALTLSPQFTENKKGKQVNKDRHFPFALRIQKSDSNSVAEQIKLQAEVNKIINEGGYPAIQQSFKDGNDLGLRIFFEKIHERAVNGQPISDLLNQPPQVIQQIVGRIGGSTEGQVITDGMKELGLYVPSLDAKLFTSKDKKELENVGQHFLGRVLERDTPTSIQIREQGGYGRAKITSHVKAGTDHQHSGANYHEHVGFANQADTANYIKAIKLADKRRGGGWYNITSTFRDGDPGDHGKGSLENPFAVDLSPPTSLPYTEEAESKWRSGMREDLRLAYKELGLTLPNFLLDNN